MTTLNLDENQAKFQIRAYKAGKIQINENIYTKSIIVTPDTLLEDWQPQTVEEITAESLQPIIALQPDILLLGTGSKLHFLSPALYGELINKNIGVEVMSTQSACSTYNALTAENRRVAAALILV